MIIISNQAAVGKGLLQPAGLEKITNKMHQALAGDGTFLAAAYYCTHRREDNCSCRKPKPGLLFSAAEDFNIDLSRSIFVGDSESDIQAASSAGCASLLFGPEIVSSPSAPIPSLTANGTADLFAAIKAHIAGLRTR
jgi:histidinol-phosphate phosphatase family protein